MKKFCGICGMFSDNREICCSCTKCHRAPEPKDKIISQCPNCGHGMGFIPPQAPASWEEEFSKWYISIYPATWKTHKVLEKIRELLQEKDKEIVDLRATNFSKWEQVLIDTEKEAVRAALEEVKREIKNWNRFVCHTRKEHADPENDCPGWSREDDYSRGVILDQIVALLEKKLQQK